MEQILINLVTGALGGVGVGKTSPTFDLGTIGNIISGLIGGGVLGQIVTLLMPAITAAAQSGDLSIRASSRKRSLEALAAPYSRLSLARSRTKLLPDGSWPKSCPDVSATLTIVASEDSSLRRLEINTWIE